MSSSTKTQILLVLVLVVSVLHTYQTWEPTIQQYSRIISENNDESLLTAATATVTAAMPPVPVPDSPKQEQWNDDHESVISSPETKNQLVSPPPAPAIDRHWCPLATCTNSKLCQPCSRRFLIMIASGRSASTTLTWMLDSLTGVRMSGENNNLLKRLKDLVSETMDNNNFIHHTGKKAPWGHNPIPDQAVACSSQAWVETINPPKIGQGDEDDSDTIVGFKTIRFVGDFDNKEKLAEMVQFVQANFPCSRIVVNLKSNITEQASSWQNNFGKSDAKEKIERENDKLKHVAELFGPQQALLLDSSEWTRNVTVLNQALDWLGFSPDCHFEKLLEFNTQAGGESQKGYANGRTSLQMNKQCLYVGA